MVVDEKAFYSCACFFLFLGQVNSLMHTSRGLTIKKQNGSIKNSTK